MKHRSASFRLHFKAHDRLDETSLKELVIRYKATKDETSREKLILHHVRLACYIAGRYIKHYKWREDDLIGAALLGLIQAVDWVPERLKDNNITPYIAVTVRRHVTDFLQNDHVINVKRKEFKKRAQNGIQCAPYFHQVEDDERDEENPQSGYTLDATPHIMHDFSGTDELYKFLATNDKYAMILSLLMEEYTPTEIATEMGITKQYVSWMIQHIRKRAAIWRGDNAQDS